jgi:carbon-monoxide dehydrogenase medium subunit
MKPPPFAYARPRSLDEAIATLERYGEEAKPLAGGQSLVPLLNFRLARPSVLVDLQWVDGLDRIEQRDGGLVVGAMVRQRTLERSPAVRSDCPLLVRALAHVGHVQIRNRGTVGGSLAHADPAAELPAVALALEAEVEAAGPEGTRRIDASDLFVGPFTTSLRPHEIVTSIRFPSTRGARTAFLEFALRRGDFALAGVAAVISSPPDEERLSGVALAALGAGPTPLRLRAAEAAMEGRDRSPTAMREAAAAASGEVEPFDDVHADAHLRRDLVGALVTRALEEAE